MPGARQPLGFGSAGLKRSTRLLFVSATYTLPAQSTAIAAGWEKSPRPVPRRPHLAWKRPALSNTCTRLFSLSSANTSPPPSTATPDGRVKAPVADCRARPTVRSTSPFCAELDDAVVALVGDVHVFAERRRADGDAGRDG